MVFEGMQLGIPIWWVRVYRNRLEVTDVLLLYMCTWPAKKLLLLHRCSYHRSAASLVVVTKWAKLGNSWSKSLESICSERNWVSAKSIKLTEVRKPNFYYVVEICKWKTRSQVSLFQEILQSFLQRINDTVCILSWIYPRPVSNQRNYVRLVLKKGAKLSSAFLRWIKGKTGTTLNVFPCPHVSQHFSCLLVENGAKS